MLFALDVHFGPHVEGTAFTGDIGTFIARCVHPLARLAFFCGARSLPAATLKTFFFYKSLIQSYDSSIVAEGQSNLFIQYQINRVLTGILSFESACGPVHQLCAPLDITLKYSPNSGHPD